MYDVIRRMMSLGMVAGALGAAAAVVNLPAGGWQNVRIEAAGGRVTFSEGGRAFLFAQAEPHGRTLADVAFSTERDALVIDARAAFSNGLVKIVFTTPGLDPARYANRAARFVYTAGGSRRAVMAGFFEGSGRPPERRHYHESQISNVRSASTEFPFETTIPGDLTALHVRLDVRQPGPAPIRLGTLRYGFADEFPPPPPKPPKPKPELLFHAAFDGTAEAVGAKGAVVPLAAQGLSYVPGTLGQGVRFTRAAASTLRYPLAGNVVPERGTIALWMKREWPDDGGSRAYRFLFGFPVSKGPRWGSGRILLWWHGADLRSDISDEDDSFRTYHVPFEGTDVWHHVAMTWHEQGEALYFDGRRVGFGRNEDLSPQAAAVRGRVEKQFDRETFDSFFVGSSGARGLQGFEGAIDDLRIYSAPLDAAAIRALSAAAPQTRPAPKPDYASLFTQPNPYEKGADAAPGTFAPGDLELVREVKLDSLDVTARLRAAKAFNSVGPLAVGTCAGVNYLECAPREGGRFALRLALDPRESFYVIDVDYPDDRVRTMDLLVQDVRADPLDYELQVGVAAGGEWPNTGRILTHRCIYWRRANDTALVAMTARDGAPAALAAVRVYRVKSRRLPAVQVNEPAAVEGWHRTIGVHFEDPAIGYDFGVERAGYGRAALGELVRRMAAKMKFTGENLLAYPGCWYNGLIGGDDGYNPRGHAPDFLTAWYEGFDREGLSFMPLLNPNTMPVEDGLVTRSSMNDGSLHATAISIHDTGRPNWGGWHGTPPNFCIAHPDTQAFLAGIVDRLLVQGRDHPSFKGIGLHVTRHCMLTFGGAEAGYNDYCLDAFLASVKGTTGEMAKRLEALRAVDRRARLRGREYARILRSDPALWERWLDWRCDVVTAFWARQGAKLAAARPDLRLIFNCFTASRPEDPRFCDEDYYARMNREQGLDARKISARIPNAVVSQCVIPADGRWRTMRVFKTEAVRAAQIAQFARRGTYALLDGAARPWVGQHDRYWESAIGEGKAHWSCGVGGQTLTCDWMKEIAWRVTTINPAGRHALAHFAVPLRYHDLLGLSKGGYLIGTYGMEPHLAAFARAFRALPAVLMRDVGLPGGREVVMRTCEFRGRSYFYVVNTSAEPRTVTVEFPPGTVDLVTGRPMNAKERDVKTRISLQSYELRSFSARPCGVVRAVERLALTK